MSKVVTISTHMSFIYACCIESLENRKYDLWYFQNIYWTYNQGSLHCALSWRVIQQPVIAIDRPKIAVIQAIALIIHLCSPSHPLCICAVCYLYHHWLIQYRRKHMKWPERQSYFWLVAACWPIYVDTLTMINWNSIEVSLFDLWSDFNLPIGWERHLSHIWNNIIFCLFSSTYVLIFI